MNRRQLLRAPLLAGASSLLSSHAAPADRPRKQLVLLLARFDQPHRDLAAATLGWMCKSQGVEFDAYYSAPRGDGGLFSPHGSTLLGGRHHGAVARAMAAFDTTVVQFGPFHALDSLPRSASRFISAEEGLLNLYRDLTSALGWKLPTRAVLFQTEGLPPGLASGIAQYLYPEAVNRSALALPLEISRDSLRSGAFEKIWTVGLPGSAKTLEGFPAEPAETLVPEDSYSSVTLRALERWGRQAASIALCEPILASHWLPFALRENHLQVFGEPFVGMVSSLARVLDDKRQTVLYGRYGGGAAPGAKNDEDLFPLSQKSIAFQVIEPARPVLTVSSRGAGKLAQPKTAPFDLEPDDAQLETWLKESRTLVSLVTHSGELSHDDAVIYTLDLCGATGVKMGIGVHWQRYAFDPECVQPMQTRADEGGMLGLVEPVLHSSGEGIVLESMASAGQLVESMKRSRQRIADIAGARFAPQGVYCYCDAQPGKWMEPATALWNAIADAGFEYVISSISQGASRLLHRRGDFVVLNLCGRNQYPFSPFLRVRELTDLSSAELRQRDSGKPGWLLGVIDVPVHACTRYLSIGRTGDDKLLRPRLGEYFEYILRGGDTGRLVTATPHTIARYARLLNDKGIV